MEKRYIVRDKICAMHTRYQNIDIVVSSTLLHRNEDRMECNSTKITMRDEKERKEKSELIKNGMPKKREAGGFGEHVHFQLHVHSGWH